MILMREKTLRRLMAETMREEMAEQIAVGADKLAESRHLDTVRLMNKFSWENNRLLKAGRVLAGRKHYDATCGVEEIEAAAEEKT